MRRAGAASPLGWQQWLFLLALMAAVFLVYSPAWRGGLLWDDDAHVTPPELRSLDGLRQIWFRLGATQQYYPLLHSFFWLQYQLWGEATLGYHLTNLALHAAAAVLAALLLRRLAVPGALWAAAIFALHPVQVESVAWIAEQKNTLAAVFYLAAALMYLRFDQTRSSAGTVPFFALRQPLRADKVSGEKGDCPLQPGGASPCYVRFAYALALTLFLLGLLSKTVTATLPAALLVVFWWQRGRLSWKRDELPLVPFFLLGIAAGVLTARVEAKLIGAEGAEYAFTPIERFLLAGRVIWFYLGKLLWPAELIFIYPRWTVSQQVWWQYLFPLAAVLLLVLLWAIRGRTRGPLAALLFFGGTLFPVLGFFNVFPFRYSLVADHFQYLASLGIITLLSAGAALLWLRWQPWAKLVGQGLCLALLLVLAYLSYRQSKIYTDAETLYTATIQRNPACWLAYNNLGMLISQTGNTRGAMECYHRALQLKADNAAAHYNLANALAALGKDEEAIEHYREALRIRPTLALAQHNWGNVLARAGRWQQAVERYEEALRLRPDYPEAHNSLAVILANTGKTHEALEHYHRALQLMPDYVNARNNLANALADAGRTDAALEHFQEALRRKPEDADLHNNLGFLLARLGRTEEAIQHYHEAVRLKRDFATAQYNLAVALARIGRTQEAIEQYDELLQRMPRSLQVLNGLAWLLATREPGEGGDPSRAVQLAQQARELAGGENAQCLDTLAAAYAAAGRFDDAIVIAQRVAQLAQSNGQEELSKNIQSRLELYRAGRPYREGPSPPKQSNP